MRQLSNTEIEPYFEGRRIYGEDLAPDEIQAWVKDETEAYFRLLASDPKPERYAYHALNVLHGFAHLPARRFVHALGFGSARGDEFEPILRQVDRLTIVEPAPGFVRSSIGGVPASYVQPSPDGLLPFESGTFDLATCFGALHHVPNPSVVVRELARCCSPGAFALIREPIHSLGDWRLARPGLTAHERGFPLELFRGILANSGFQVVREKACMFPLVPRIARLAGTLAYSSPGLTRLDRMLCSLTEWNSRYHRTSVFRKAAPWAAFFVLQKQP